MKKSYLWGVLCACFLLLGNLSANASTVPLDGEIHLSLNPTFDPLTDTTGVAAFAVPFNLYVIGDNFTDTSGILGFEWGLSSPNLDGSLVVLGFTPSGPGPINAGTNTNVIVGTGGAVPNAGQVVLGTYQLLALAPLVDELLTISASVPSSVGGGGPAWVAAGGHTLYEFGFSSNLLLNQDQLPTPAGAPPTPEIPIPAAVWLFGSGLLGLVGVARRKNSM